MDICGKINFPVSAEKTFWPRYMLVFLGLLIDTINRVVAILQEKIDMALTGISELIRKCKVTIKEIQRICGYLNFLCCSVVPGRAFTRRLYTITENWKNAKGESI